MQLVSIKATIAMLWVSTVSIVGVAANVNSLSNWTAFGVVALIPLLVMMWRWNDPLPTMSQSIQEALR